MFIRETISVSRIESTANMTHDYCRKRINFDNRIEDTLDDRIFGDIDMDTEYLTQNLKYGDELLIDLIRSRPFLYDKKLKEYRDIKNMKEHERK